jgi:hypothetical protein
MKTMKKFKNLLKHLQLKELVSSLQSQQTQMISREGFQELEVAHN